MNKYISKKYLIDNLKGFKEEVLDTEYTNVQSDWNVTDTTSDAFIKNKPTILTTDETQALFDRYWKED